MRFGYRRGVARALGLHPGRILVNHRIDSLMRYQRYFRAGAFLRAGSVEEARCSDKWRPTKSRCQSGGRVVFINAHIGVPSHVMELQKRSPAINSLFKIAMSYIGVSIAYSSSKD